MHHLPNGTYVNIDPGLLLPLLPVLVLTVLLIALCLVDLARRPRVKHLPKAVWALIVLFAVPMGAVVYLVIGRDKGVALRDEDLR